MKKTKTEATEGSKIVDGICVHVTSEPFQERVRRMWAASTCQGMSSGLDKGQGSWSGSRFRSGSRSGSGSASANLGSRVRVKVRLRVIVIVDWVRSGMSRAVEEESWAQVDWVRSGRGWAQVTCEGEVNPCNVYEFAISLPNGLKALFKTETFWLW